ncbi:E3 ubiquitin-protein ligase bre1 [Varicellaria rhodocarpa]|nr:E3 ubiquitin-protein ligase bre1 [Varicellaria rhodocarpa]
MEERKRPATCDHEESVPPHKRQVTSVNGGSKNHHEIDLPGKDELEKFQKEAIWRQMQEFKREKTTLEARLADMSKRAAYHDDHLRTIDSWFNQLLDEIKISLGQVEDPSSTQSVFPSSLLSTENAMFEKYLKSRSDAISSTISQLFTQRTSTPPEISALQARIVQLLSTEKRYLNDVEESRLEKKQLEERLESASIRYMVAEKKLDRAKSITVAKLERQTMGSRSEGSNGLGGSASGGTDLINGQSENGERLAVSEAARKEAVAASAKKQEQLELLGVENEKLTVQVTSLSTKLSGLSDEDYAHTDLFKYIKSQHEEVIKRVNDLEFMNVQLRQEAERLQAERTTYRIQLENETQAIIGEKELLLTQADNNLARVRAARDELSADLQMRKATNEQERDSVNQIKELSIIQDERIKSLESEIERLKVHAGQSDSLIVPTADLDQIPTEELRIKYVNLDQQYSMLGKDLSSMSNAYKKMSATASKKVGNLSALEEKVKRLQADKSKADQKYFGAMKAKESNQQELRALRTQNAKSSEVVSQLKESNTTIQALVANLEKNLVEMKDTVNTLMKQNKASQQQAIEKSIIGEGLKSQIEELKKALVVKDASISSLSSLQRKSDVELEELKIKLQDTKKSLESWKSKGLGNQTEEYEGLRALALCNICKKNFKDTVLKNCGHVYCKECVDKRLESRMRKCPDCTKSFGANDHMPITLYQSRDSRNIN